MARRGRKRRYLRRCAVFENELALQEMGDPRKWRVKDAGLNGPFSSPV